MTMSHEELVRALIVERFSRSTPPADGADPARVAAYPAVREGCLQPNPRNVRSRPYRRPTPVSRRNP